MRQWLRSHLTFGNVTSLLALFVALGGTTYAATGGNFILGKPNSADKTTSLSASPPFSGKALQLTNTGTGTGATALGLNVASGHPPFTVNSGTKVMNLNADRLDGLDSTAFVPSSKLRRVGPVGDTFGPGQQGLTVPIATVGHFTFTGFCARDIPNPGDGGVQLGIESNAAHSSYGSLTQSQAGGQFGQADMNAGTGYPLANIGPGPISGPVFHPVSGSAVAPDGQQVSFDVYQGAGIPNQVGDCIFGGTFAVK
jgi:hypothetical protein